uniref:Uncharacterized protein n=1 Tax=Anolis carolinensis TaxID=28377 RepID=A0A803SSP7_ANOCA
MANIQCQQTNNIYRQTQRHLTFFSPSFTIPATGGAVASLSTSGCTSSFLSLCFRLPAEVHSIIYGLCLKLDLIDFSFEGKLKASGGEACNQPDCDVLQGDEEIHAMGVHYQNEDEKASLSFPYTLQKGMGTLRIDSVGELNDKYF